MVVFPWLALAAVVLLVSIGIVALVARLWTRGGRKAPFTVGLASGLLVALPLLLLLLAWGIVLKPR